MESLSFEQEDCLDRISKAFSNFKKAPKERLTEQYVDSRLEQLEKQWSRFADTHKKIMETIDVKKLRESEYYKEDQYTTAEEIYIDYKCLLKLKQKNLSEQNGERSTTTGQTDVNLNLKLPKIVIPRFSGNYNEWITFRDLFMSLVHNTPMDRALKMQYLKGLLSGEAEQLVRHVNISTENYERCWAMLEERYNNKRYLSQCILTRLFNQKNVVGDSATNLKELIDTTTECLGALSNLGVDVSSWDIIIIHMLSLRLDPESRKQWELQAANTASHELPKFDQFKEFITNRYRALEIVDSGPKFNRAQFTQRPRSFLVTGGQCKFCNENHRIVHCQQFINTELQARRTFVERNNLCFNCLGSNHSAKQCQNVTSCRSCNRRHHTLLHPRVEAKDRDQDSPTESGADSSKLLDSAPVVCFSSGEIPSASQVLLATALVKAEAGNGESKTIRALLDQGSQASFVTEATAQYLRLKKVPVQGRISGLGQNATVCAKYMVNLRLTSIHDPNIKLTVQVYVLKTITTLLPSRRLVAMDWVCELPLADPQYHTPNQIDILLGADVYCQVIQEGVRKGPEDSLIAQNTSLGWILSGVTVTAQSYQPATNLVAMHTCVEENELLKKFWEIEADPIYKNKHILTEEETRCEELFAKTTSRDTDGRYIVKLPFRTEEIDRKIKNSKKIAEKRLKLLKTKLSKSKDMETKYADVMEEYLLLEHMEKIPENEISNPKAVYLSHFAVLRYDKDTTQVRIVFDASCKGENGISLNDLLMVGPTLQPELRHLLMRWRLHRICLSADIVKMYRQIKVAHEDVDFQRILWNNSPETGTQEYRLLRVTFGTASAPYLAVKTLQQVAHDEGARYPAASEKVISDFYMDDLLTGCETIEQGVQIYSEMNELLTKAGFKLQKWSSNSEELLEKLKETQEGICKEERLKLKIDDVMKLLGLTWNRTNDAFQYTVTLPQLKEPVTKRIVISDIARLFDPLGWVAPSVIVAKILIQKLWISRIEWDEEIPKNILNEWLTYRKELTQLGSLLIPRWIGTTETDELVELHGFCDASKLAYAAAVYVRVVDKQGNVHVSLLTAKTKVAPIKQISIPRLELCGAVLLSKLLLEVATVIKIPKKFIHAWTDSTVVLAWLNSHPNRWQTFVANRVSEILISLDSQHWNHVKSQQNPADCASRGLEPSKLADNSLWLMGPEILHGKEVPYNKQKDAETNLEEVKVHLVTENDNIWEKFSSLTRLIRVIAYCRRVLTWKNVKERQQKGSLSTQELKEALDVCIRKCQGENFREEISKLQNQRTTKLKGAMKPLNPFIDAHKILRVGGRLEKAPLEENRKHPILLPKTAVLTNLIIADAHFKTLHGGPQLMLTYLRSKYWILGAKELVKSYVRKCVKCVRYLAKTRNQLMGQLPAARVTPSRPFKCSGVDYAGPINIKTSKGRGQHSYKGYICLFVCMVTKALHIEVVSDLTTQGFLAAFKRFVSRRGYCSDIWSDNGTNFLGASRELHALFSTEKSGILKELVETLAQNGTNWHFIPPHSPNFGGLWEAGIKSVKFHLKRVIGDSTLTYEELATVLAQIEACLNSRPLSRIENESEGFNALTPGHFLVGEPLLTVPDYNFEASNVSSLRRWQLIQKMMQSFWRRWSQEYLTTFLHRYKWSFQTPEPKIGDLVLIKEDDLPPSRWLLGRVVTKHSGEDGITRVVSLRTKSSIVKRPTSKICILPISSD